MVFWLKEPETLNYVISDNDSVYYYKVTLDKEKLNNILKELDNYHYIRFSCIKRNNKKKTSKIIL